MSAAHVTLERLEDVEDEAPRRRGREREPIRSAVMTAPGGRDRHVHCLVFFGETGTGFSSPGPDGHIHKVKGLDVMPNAGHTHDLSARRCNERHDHDTGRHIKNASR